MRIITHFRSVLIGLLTMAILAPAASGQQPDRGKGSLPQLVQNISRIEVKKSALFVNGSIVKLPISLTDLEKLIGPPSRTVEKINYISTWDDLGLLAYQKDESSDVFQLSVILNNLDMEIEFWPGTVFGGILVIDGARIKSNDSNSSINRKKTGKKFKPVSPITPFLLEIKSGSLQVNISRASRGDFSASGKIVEVSIASLEE